MNIIKRSVKIILASVILYAMPACTPEVSEETIKLQQELNQLKAEMAAKDSTLSAFDATFSSIQQNLAAIREKEASIKVSSGELKDNPDMKEQITMDIQAINTLLAENKAKIQKLQNSLKSSGGEVKALKKIIDGLNFEIEAKEVEISSLKENLAASNFTIDMLNGLLDSSNVTISNNKKVIADQTNVMNTAYYTIGTYKELESRGVVDKKGGIIGIAATKIVKSDFKKDGFTKVDITQVSTISLNSKKVQLLTVHPADSYTLDGEDIKTLNIKDAERFWSASKYLVVVIK